jgi:hypothetical protein
MKHLRLVIWALILATLAGRSGGADAPISVLPTVDFKDTFPHMVWVSSEGRDAEYPAGFRYKLLSVRSGDSRTVEFALVRELTGGDKIVALHAKGPLSKFNDAANGIVDDFSSLFSITFEKFDLSEIRTFEDFEARTKELGWIVDAPSQ